MNSRINSVSTISAEGHRKRQRLSSPFKFMLEILTHYETPKIVRFESKWIASLSLFVKLSVAVSCIYLMFQTSSYQISDRSPISAVTIKVHQSENCTRNSAILDHFPKHNCSQSVYDVNDFILPPTENSAISITIRSTKIEHVLRFCDNTTKNKDKSNYSSIYPASINTCAGGPRCILPPFYRKKYDSETATKNDDNKTTSRESELCWFELPNKNITENYQALDYVLFIKNYVEFTQIPLIRKNIEADILASTDIRSCEYHPEHNQLCPKFRILKILEMIKKNNDTPDYYENMFLYGSLIEIRISWKCNLDKHLKYCKPNYKFERLDVTPYDKNPYYPGSNFLTARHFFRPNDRELRRVHTNIINLHIIVSVTGEVGRWDLFQTTTSIGSFLGIFAAGTIVCDRIAAFLINLKSVKYER